MRNLSSFIASTAQHGEPKPMGVWAVGMFVAVLLAGSAAVAFWMGSSIQRPGAYVEAAPIAFADEGFQ